MNILVLNTGSSSLKFQLVCVDGKSENVLASGLIDRIGGEALIHLTVAGKTSKQTAPLRDISQALAHLIKALQKLHDQIPGFQSLADIHGVGHRVVHGGERFQSSVLITPAIQASIVDCIELAPLHNPSNIKGIEAMQEILGPNISQVAVFDTAFHATMPETAWLYALPYSSYRRHKIRRYGFHGTSYRYVSEKYRSLSGTSLKDCNIIIFHLGNGCSAVAIREGRSIDTSMGMTPTEGLVMGTRSGDLDPAALELLATKEGMTLNEVQIMLNRNSGLLGISGITSDMRDLVAEVDEHQDRRAQLAIDIFCYRARKYLGSYMAAVGPVKAVIFSGGIGENSALVREKITSGLEHMGINFDTERNTSHPQGKDSIISKPESPVEIRVIATNEEIMIARDTRFLIEREPKL
ncbi:MAG: acetate kinase [Chitinophagaceae bacterium]|nr:acetate kinase [Oligoflexus sp.]